MSATNIIHLIPHHRATAINNPMYGNLPVVIRGAGVGKKITAKSLLPDSNRSPNLIKTR